ncbi:MAG: hypothetical protein HRT35_29835, partial [Algicola sp.]|nr:hypothetical protein [Algicola sp.]
MDFSGFSPDSFEQLTQALALKVLGPGVSIFGNGPDGGREATFNGKINFPYPPNEQWQGYGVIQAKFKEKSETTQKDQSWAIKQLEHELSLWEDNDNRDPKPDYFIYCTNVELSAATNGGIDKVNALLEGYRLSLGLKGFDVWDANKLAALVDGQEDIRKRFTNFFTSGDLLAAFASQLTEAPDAEAILTTYLCNEIEYDADARLSQAGDKTDDRIKLADVFIDLPTGEQTPDEEVPANTINQLLRWASFKLDPKALYEHNSNWVDGAAKLFNRFVFLGGPGSGKSTIGQFMSQIHRAALLSRRPEYQLKSKVLRIIESTKMRCEQEQFAWPTTPRYPFRIDLNDFAKALATTPANDGVKTLSEYLRNKLSKNDQISHQTLKAWLKAYPWLLIFDGLDEVPTSSNRTDVIAEIQSFLNDAQFVGADIMIVGTSRPDGYSGEFGEDEIVHNHLSPLPPALALSCAQRYVSAKYTSKEDPRATGAMKILREAIDNPLVAKLMQSQLQVT